MANRSNITTHLPRANTCRRILDSAAVRTHHNTSSTSSPTRSTRAGARKGPPRRTSLRLRRRRSRRPSRRRRSARHRIMSRLSRRAHPSLRPASCPTFCGPRELEMPQTRRARHGLDLFLLGPDILTIICNDHARKATFYSNTTSDFLHVFSAGVACYD